MKSQLEQDVINCLISFITLLKVRKRECIDNDKFIIADEYEKEIMEASITLQQYKNSIEDNQ